ncbi:hypothetical protein DIE11_17530 [Burkholderia sp. Bp9012]|uniref:hypothetical protein n=1 Tax=Burkholderia sp. Bp9012 TaxID=2184562 RepID=UPI000F5B58B4|nr:hypothetical protein [Burkholderia sp. Bp9012]RQR79194.1 hypothetical protein DIE11_17530 [Burkholderia sp. Bp9012]
MSSDKHPSIGKLAWLYLGRELPLEILRSANGYYLGTSENHQPVSRESIEYFRSRSAAETALHNGTWTQRITP